MSKVPFFKDSECCPKILDYTLPEVASNYYSCLKCDQHVYDRQSQFFCNICNIWVHRSCTGTSEKEYKDLQNDKPWFCRPYKMCVSLLTNNQLIITHDYNKTK